MSYQTLSWAAALCAATVLAAPATAQEATQQSAEKPADEAAKRATSKQAIEAALKKKVDAQLVQFPLAHLDDWAEKEGGFSVEIDLRALRDAGIDHEAVELNLIMPRTSLAAIFHHALRPYELTYVLQNDVLMITTLDAAHGIVEVQIYPAADLVKFRESGGNVRTDATDLAELLFTTCSQDTWDRVGGMGSLGDYDGLLIVSQTREVQFQIAGLLDTLRAAVQSQRDGRHGSHTVQSSASPDTRVHAALDRSVDISLEWTALGELDDYLRKVAGVPVLFDARALLDSGLDTATIRFSRKYSKAPLRNSLDRMLREWDLAYVVDHEAIVITTRDRAETMLESHVYPVADLLAAEAAAGESRMARADKLAELLTTSVDAASWDYVGGSNHVHFAAPWNLLVVSAPAATHRKVADTLDRLRDARRRQAELDLAPTDAPADEDPIELRVFAIPAATAENPNAPGEVAQLVRDLIPIAPADPISNPTANAADPHAPLLRVAADRLIVRDRRSVLAKVESLLKQLKSPPARDTTAPSAR